MPEQLRSLTVSVCVSLDTTKRSANGTFDLSDYDSIDAMLADVREFVDDQLPD